MKLKLRKEKNINKLKSPNYAHLAGRAFGDLNSFFSPMFFLSLVLMLGIGQKGYSASGYNLKVKETNPKSQNEIANETINSSNETENLIEGEEANSNQNLIYIDSELENPEVLLDAVMENFDEKTLFIFSHGKPGQLLIDGDWLTAKELVDWIPEQEEFSGFENIQIYGCEFGKGEIGEKAVSYLTSNLDVSISASNDLTGIDGNWDLEVGSNPKVDIVPDYDFNLQVSYLKEAENYTTIVNESGGDYWSTETDGSETVIQALDNDGSLFNNKTGASVSYAFAISNSDNYYIHIRAKAGSGGGSDDSYHWDLNDGGLTTENSNLNNSFQWRTYGTNSLNAGTNTLNIYEREDGVIIDKVMLSTESSPTTALNYVVAAPAAPPSSNCVELELATDGEFNNSNEFNSYSSDLPKNYNNGQHRIEKNPRNYWNWAPSFTDHTGNNGYMIIADGANYSGHRVWYNTYYIPQGTTVTLSVWVRDFWGGNDAAKLYWGVNGVQVGTLVTAQAGVWTLLSTTYTTTTSGNVTFGIHNQQTSGNGNDFAIDDVSILNCVTPTCSGNFYDTGGPSGNYSQNESYTRTYCAPYGQRIRFAFSSFKTASNNDRLQIYDGIDQTYNRIANLNNSDNAGTYTSTNNCLTISFSSNNGSTDNGWSAAISCIDDSNCDDLEQLLINTLSGGSDIDITSGATIYSNQLPSSWNLEAYVTGSRNGSVGFDISGTVNDSQTDNSYTYRYLSGSSNLGWGPGTYNISAKLYQGSNRTGKVCGVVNSTLIIDNCNLTGFAPSSNSPVCTGTSINLNAGSLTGATYAWTGPNGFTSTSQSPSITNVTTSANGNYSVTVTKSGCTSSAVVAVIIYEAPSVTVTKTNANCGLNNGSLSLAIVNNASRTNIEFSINGGTTYLTPVSDAIGTHVISNLAPATYNVWARWTGNDCPVSLGSYTVIRQSGTGSISGTSTICVGQSTTLTASLLNGVSPITYSWTPTAGTASITVSPLSNSNYSVSMTDGNGCTATANVGITVNPKPTATPSSNSPVCNGGTLNLTAANGMSSYSWTGPLGTYGTQNPSLTNVNQTYSGTYVLTVQNSNGCSNTASTAVTVSNALTPTATNAGPYCVGQDIVLTASGGNTYAWIGPSSFSATGITATRTSATLGMGGIYTVTATQSGTGCTASATTNVSVLAKTIGASNNGPKCQGLSLTLTATGGNGTFSWSGPNSFSATGSSTTINNVTISREGVYTTTSYITPSCPATATTEVIINSLPNISVTDTIKVCAGENGTLTASGGTSYNWVGPNSFNQTNTSGTVTVSSVNSSKVGMYTVTATNAAGCSATAKTYLLASIASLNTSSNSPVCQGSSIQLNASGVLNYSWSGPAGFSSGTANNTISSASSANDGNYLLTASNSLGCTATATVKVNVLLNNPVITGTSAVCAKDSIKMSLPFWSTYSWTGPNSFTSSSSTPFIANSTASNQGTYSVTVSKSGCTATATFNVTVNALPNVTGATTVCKQSTLSLTANGATSYTWVGPNSYTNSTSSVSIGNANSILDGKYILTGIDGNSCIDKDSVTVFVSFPNLVASGGGSVCLGSSVSFTASGGNSYTWIGPSSFSSESQNPTISNVTSSNSGTYTVTATDGNSCTSLVTVSAFVSIPNSGPSAASTTVCLNGSLSLSGGGGVGYTWTEPQGFTSTLQSPIINNMTTNKGGYYKLAIIDAVGCQDIDSVLITVSVPPTATAANNGPVCIGSTLNLTGAAGDSYYWAGPNGFASSVQNPIITNITAAAAGTYTTYLYNSYSCFTTATTAVTTKALPVPTATTTNGNVCIAQNIALTATGGATYSWLAPDAATYTGQNYTRNNATLPMSGIYTVTVTGSNACTATATVNASVHPLPDPPSVSNVFLCGAGTASITASGCSGTYRWYASNASTTVLGSAATYVTPTLSIGTVEDYFVNCTIYTCPSSTKSPSIVTVYQPPTNVTASNSGVHCVYTTAKLFGSANFAVSYSWAGPGGFTSNLQSPTFVTGLNSAGVYTLTATASNGCTQQATTSLTLDYDCSDICNTWVRPDPSNPTACANTNGYIHVNDYGNGNYEASIDGLSWISTGSPQNGYFNNLGVGSHLIYIRDKNSDKICQTAYIDLRSNGGSYFTSASSTPSSGCFVKDGTITLSGILSTDEVSWIGLKERVYVAASTLTNGNKITNLEPGTYYVRVKRYSSVYCYVERLVTIANTANDCNFGDFCDASTASNKFPNGDFGSGTNLQGPPLGSGETDYGYVAQTCNSPNDGYYSIVNSLDCNGSASGGRIFGTWEILTQDHTPGDVNGYMMVVNASIQPDVVVERVITDLCPNSKYNFTAWVKNVYAGGTVLPNLAFLINGVAKYTTGNITTTDWQKVGFSFKTGNVAPAAFSIRNNNPGGNGNDWVIDDIVISKCPLIIGLQGITVACEGGTNEDITATVEDPLSEHQYYKWQKRITPTDPWTDVSGVIKGTYVNNVMNVNYSLPTPIPFAISGTDFRMVLAADSSGFSNPSCVFTSEFTEILVPTIQVLVTSDTAKCIGSGAVTISASAENGTAPYTFTWDNGLGTGPSKNVNPSVTTSYIVNASDATNCPSTDTILVEVSPQPTLSVTIDEDSVCLNGEANITAHVVGGSSVFDYTWYTTEDTNSTWSIIPGEKDSILVLNTNTEGVKFYRVFVEDLVFDCNDAMSNPVMFTIFSNATANVSITDTTFCLGGSMSISAIVTGGTGALTYQWQQSINGSSPWVDISGETNLNLSIPSSTVGTQYYRYAANSSASGCYIPVSDSAHVRILDVFGVDLSVNNDTVCIGGNVELLADTTNGVGNVGYQWYSSSNGTSFSTISGETNLNYIANTATEGTMYYKVVASSAGVGCGTASSDSAIVKVLPVFDVTVSLENNIVCMGGAVELLADTINGTGNITYQWMQSSDGTNYTNITDSTKVTLHPSTAIDGTKYYKVAATASGSGCGTVVSDSAIVEVLPIFGVDISLSDVIVCQGGLVTLTADTSNGVGDITYQWLSSTDNVNFSPISGETGLTHTANTSSAGTTYYIVEATATGSGCGTVPSASASLEVLPNFAVDIAIDNAVVCIGGGVTISADTTSGTGNITYQWFNSPDGNSFSPLSGENGLTYSAPTSNIGTIYYRVVATASGTGCGTATSDSATVEVLEVFDVEVTIDNAIVCIGGVVELLADTVNGTGNITYQWLQSSDGSNFTVMTDSTNIAMHPSTAIDGTKYYKVAATASGSGCGTVDSDSAVVRVLPIFGVDIDLTDDVVCIGGAVTLTADTTNGVGDITYQWLSSPNNGTYTEISGETGLIYTPNTSSEGTIYYMVEATATGSGCGTVPSPKVPIQVLPIFDIDIAIDNAIVCEGGSVVITADTINGTGNITYQWYTSADGSSFSPMSGETALSYTPPTGSAGITYYQVTATASGTGCGTVTSDSAIVEVLPQISISIDPGIFSVCTREVVQLDASTQNGVGTFTYQWQSSSDNVNWSNIVSASDTLYQPSTALAGIFYYRIIASPDGVGCESDTSASVTVTVYGFPVVSVSKENALCVTDNGEITFTFSNEPNQSEIQLSIDNGVTYPYVVPDNLGTYTVDSLSLGLYHMFARWGDSHCPVDLDTLRITERPPPAAIVTYVDPSCTVSNGSITFTFDDNLDRTNLRFSLDSGLTYNPNVPDNSGTVTYDYLAPGTYKLFVMWENGDCPVDLGEVTLTDHPGPILTVSSDTVICYGSNASLLASTTSGDAPITFTWNNGLPNGATQTVSPAVDTYFVVTASDANGCFATDSIFVEVNPLPVVSLTGGEYCEGDDVYLTATGGVSYQWSGPNSYSSTAQNPVILSADTLSRGYFQVLVTDVNYCQTTDSVEVIINAAPSAPILADGFICGPGIVTLTSSGCSGVTTWHDNQFNNSVVGLGTTFETTLLGASKNYYVSCTSTSNCVSFDRATAKAEIREISNADVLPINSTCVGDVALNNGILMITGFREGERYSFSEGTTFNSSTAIPASPGLIPVNGRVFGDIQNPTTPNSYYTVRLISRSLESI
jgi:large repetitive protein